MSDHTWLHRHLCECSCKSAQSPIKPTLVLTLGQAIQASTIQAGTKCKKVLSARQVRKLESQSVG